MSRAVALVTGASSGIGLELARLLAADGVDLVLVARSAERLEVVARELHERHGVSVLVHPRDLSRPDAARTLWDDLASERVQVDVLVNNAGVGLHGPFSEQNLDSIERLVTLNVSTLATLTRLALPSMLARRSGRILLVASIVAYQPGGPLEALYYASKSFVLSFAKGLATELRGSGVSLTALCPGPVHTAFERSAGASETALYQWVPALPAAAVARAGYRGMMRGASVVIPGAAAKLLALAGELPPRRIALEANRLLLRQRKGTNE